MEWIDPVITFLTRAPKDPSGWIQLGVGMALALVMLALYRKALISHAKEREEWMRTKTQLQSVAENALKHAEDLRITIQKNTEQELALAKEREKHSEEHASLHESERNILLQAVASLTESMTALKTLLEATLLRPSRRRK